jgi:hypothetical protein
MSYIDNLKYLDHDLYQVEENNSGGKVIHIDGYCYWDGDEPQLVQGTWLYIDINDAGNAETIAKAWAETKQYQGEITEDKIREYYKNAKELPYEKVTQDTPCGWYVDF